MTLISAQFEHQGGALVFLLVSCASNGPNATCRVTVFLNIIVLLLDFTVLQGPQKRCRNDFPASLEHRTSPDGMNPTEPLLWNVAPKYNMPTAVFDIFLPVSPVRLF